MSDSFNIRDEAENPEKDYDRVLRPKTFEDCILFSRQQFEKYFSHDI
jgi:hypothetical protein